MWKFRRIAAGGVARVDLCDDCNAVSVSMGAITIRIDRNALGSLIQTLIEAHDVIEKESVQGGWTTGPSTRGIA